MSSSTSRQDSLNDLKEELQEQRNRNEEGYASAWRPDTGDILVGTLKDYKEDVQTQYGVCDVAEISDPDGQRQAVWLFHRVLENLWEEENPEIGDNVGVLYLGETTPKNGGSSYHNYELLVEKNTSTEVNETNQTPSNDPAEIPF